KIGLSYHTDAATGTFADCPNNSVLRYNCTTTTTLNQNQWANLPRVTQQVKEAALETNIPLLSDVPGAKKLEINAAARYTTYNTSGDYWTWKAGLNWRIVDDVSLRGTKSRDIRAPTLYDMFQPLTSTTINNAVQRFTTGQPVSVGSVSSFNQGNPNLEA